MVATHTLTFFMRYATDGIHPIAAQGRAAMAAGHDDPDPDWQPL